MVLFYKKEVKRAGGHGTRNLAFLISSREGGEDLFAAVRQDATLKTMRYGTYKLYFWLRKTASALRIFFCRNLVNMQSW